MAEKVNISKYCLENSVDPIALMKLMRNRGYPIYKIGGTYFVDSVDSIVEALVIDNQRRVELSNAKSEKARDRAERARMEREFIGSLEARGLSLEQAQELINRGFSTLNTPPGNGGNQGSQ